MAASTLVKGIRGEAGDNSLAGIEPTKTLKSFGNYGSPFGVDAASCDRTRRLGGEAKIYATSYGKACDTVIFTLNEGLDLGGGRRGVLSWKIAKEELKANGEPSSAATDRSAC